VVTLVVNNLRATSAPGSGRKRRLLTVAIGADPEARLSAYPWAPYRRKRDIVEWTDAPGILPEARVDCAWAPRRYAWCLTVV
jgi:hypothetical protein